MSIHELGYVIGLKFDYIGNYINHVDEIKKYVDII